MLVVDGENTVNQARITINGEDRTDYIVETGLNPGDTVITQGVLKVRAGAPVNPVQAEAAAQ